MSEVIGYLDRPILAKFRRNIPGIIKNEIVSGNFDIKIYFSRGVHLRNTSRIFLVIPTCLDNQSEYRKKLNSILLVDVECECE